MSGNFTIDPRTRCGTVALIVTDLARSVRFYTEQIGLQLLRREDGCAWLGVADTVLLHLTEQPGARPVTRGRTGLYHFAILTPSRHELSRTLHHLLATNTRLDGASDHGVSEALYLADPDGHGIEIYRDRPRPQWPVASGRLEMTLDPLDARGLLAEAPEGTTGWMGMHPETTIGHVHLHVASIPAAEAFYVDLLGLELMQRFGGQASFVAAGGYHHHLGLNTWAGVGAPPPPAEAARLAWYALLLPDAPALRAVVDRLAAAGVAVTEDAGRWQVHDPAQNQVVLAVAPA